MFASSRRPVATWEAIRDNGPPPENVALMRHMPHAHPTQPTPPPVFSRPFTPTTWRSCTTESRNCQQQNNIQINCILFHLSWKAAGLCLLAVFVFFCKNKTSQDVADAGCAGGGERGMVKHLVKAGESPRSQGPKEDSPQKASRWTATATAALTMTVQRGGSCISWLLH